MNRYNPAEIEPKWQTTWAESKVYEVTEDPGKAKFVMLTEFPYPSGDGLHLGHTREYTLGDIIARHKRMQGYNVLYPMGYDAFGLPTENFAIKHKIAPQVATDRNVATFQKQFESLGFSFDWSRSFRTTDPSYYKWTQWLFLQFYKHGLAYQDDISINWCPHCKTGLANEEVVNGRHERCDTLVEKKQLKQWLLRITKYADRLIEGLNDVDYPSRIADQQVNWIGKSVGAEIDFVITGSNQVLRVFTTRPDTLYGVTFMVIAPEHEYLTQLTSDEQRKAVDAYVEASQNKSEIERQDTSREKTGVFTGGYVLNPLTHEKIPVWTADYVLSGYGTGAIMAVPAHDERDFAFAQKFGLPIKNVVAQDFGVPLENAQEVTGSVVIAYDPAARKFAGITTGTNNGLWLMGGGTEGDETFEETAIRELKEESGFATYDKIVPLGEPVYSYYFNDVKQVNKRSYGQGFLFYVNPADQGEAAREAHENFELGWYDYETLKAEIEKVKGGVHHWLEMLERAKKVIDGQGADTCYHGDGVLVNSGAHSGLSSAEAREQIVAHLEREGVGHEKVNFRLRDWIFSRQHYWGEPIPIIHCEEHGAVAVPEDQLPVVLPDVEQYEPTDTGESPLAAIDSWVNTTCPTCGRAARRETDTMPNWAGSSWYYLRYFDAHNDQAFADIDKLKYWGEVDLYLGGMEHTTLHLLYSRFWHQFFYDIGLVPTREPYAARRGQGIILAADGTKMSKSKGNVVNPTEIIEAGYGADALRLCIAFLAPYDLTTPWSPEGVAGTHRFVSRIWALVDEHQASDLVGEVPVQLVHKAIKKVSQDLERMSFNTAIAAQMEFVNELYKLKMKGMGGETWEFALRTAVQLLAPFAPHIAEELWQQLGHQGSVHVSKWPAWDEALLVQDTVTIVVQVNGKVRAELSVAKDASRESIESEALAHERVQEFLGGTQPSRVIYVPGRLVNIVAT